MVRISQETIESVKDRADIVDVVSQYVVLRKRGKEFVGLCPFHDEKSPSFTVSQTKQMYYCFGCQAGGNAIKFLMDVGKRKFPDAVVELARQYQVEVTTENPNQTRDYQRQLSLQQRLYEVMASASQFYQYSLRQDHGKLAYDYLRSHRQLPEAVIKKFSLGYAPAGWSSLYKYLVETRQYPADLVEQAGLIKPRQGSNGYYDVFRDRLMIPIRDVQGRVIAFGARTLSGEQPKYLNSPDTLLFSKSKTLFALDHAKDSIGKVNQAVVVEGYFDAIALHGAGVTNVVASLGTALTIDHVRAAMRFTESKQLVLNFDADKAGNVATQRAIAEVSRLACQGELQLKILTIPNGKDADEYLQTHTPAEYSALLASAPLWLDWQIEQILRDRDLHQPGDFQLVSGAMVEMLKGIQDISLQGYYISHCGEILSLGNSSLIPLRVENLQRQLRRVAPVHQVRSQSVPANKQHKPANQVQAESLLLRIYLHCPDQRQSIADELGSRNVTFTLEHYQALWNKLSSHSGAVDVLSTVQTEYMEQGLLEPVADLFQLVGNQEWMIQASGMYQSAIASMEKTAIEKRCKELLQAWQETGSDEDYQLFTQEKAKLKELQACGASLVSILE